MLTMTLKIAVLLVFSEIISDVNNEDGEQSSIKDIIDVLGTLIEKTRGTYLESIRMKNINSVMIAKININSIRNKFEILSGYYRNI